MELTEKNLIHNLFDKHMKSVDESYFKVVVFKGPKLGAYHSVENYYL